MAASIEPATPQSPERSRWARHAGRVYGILFLAYGIFVVYGSLVPLTYHDVLFADALDQVTANPVEEIRDMAFDDVQIHVLLYLPLTFLGMGFVTRANAANGRAFLAVALLSLAILLSVSVEIAQVYVPPRTACFGHWSCQCVGALLGIVAWYLLGGVVTRWVGELGPGRHPRRVAIYTLTAYLAALLVFLLLPLDVPTSWARLFDKLEHATYHLVPFSDPVSPWHVLAKLAELIPVGYLFSQLGRRGYTVGAATAMGLVFVVLLSAVDVSLSSGQWSSTDILLETVGAGVGAWLADRFGPSATKNMAASPGWIFVGRVIGLAGVIGVAAAVAYFKWRPFDFQIPAEGLWARFRSEVQIPFYHQYWLNSFHAMRNTLVQLGTFVVLGLSARCVTTMFARGSRSRIVPGLLVALLAIALEGGRLLIPSRITDITAVMISVAGGLAGVFFYPTFIQVYVQTLPPPTGRSG